MTYNVDNSKQLNILSFCSGYLGLEKGLSQAGLRYRTITYVEIEAFVCFNLVKKMEQGMVDKAPIWTDLKTFDPRPFYNKVHGIVGGYPCQGESAAGQRKLEEDPRFLWPYIEKSIKTIRPVFCFFENVDKHLSGSFPTILQGLRSMGYQVEAVLCSAVEVGAPHTRKRLFILAYTNRTELRKVLANTYLQPRNLSNKPQRRKKTTIGKVSKDMDDSFCERLQEGASIQMENREEASFLLSQSDRTIGKTSILSDTNGIRSRQSCSKLKTKFFVQNGSRWPVGPEFQQHKWEAPRTIKSGMGCTIDGYDFRRDLLRLYGNGVVPQTASKAWQLLITQILY